MSFGTAPIPYPIRVCMSISVAHAVSDSADWIVIDFRAFARSDAARALLELAPTEPTVRISPVLRRLSCPPREAMARLSEHLLSEIEEDRVDEATAVLAVAERFIQRGRPAYLDVAIVGLLESLHAGVSHRPASTEAALVALLPEACGHAWEEIRKLFEEVADGLGTGGSAVTEAEILSNPDPAGAARMRSNYWRSPDGVLVGAADVLAFKLAESAP